MKKGTCAMAGFAVLTLQRFNASTMYCVVLAMFGRYQAARRYLRCLRWLARFDLATICLALAFVFSGTIGAVAQTAVPGPDQKVAPGAMVVLDGSASTPSPGNTIGSYSWVSTSTQADCDPAPPHPTSGVRVSFTAEDLAPGAADVTYCFFMKIDQVNGDGSPWVPVKVTVSHSVAPPPAANKPPISDAGPNQTVNSGLEVTLDGSGSTDSDGDDMALKYSWVRTEGTGRGTGGNVTLTGANTQMPTFTPTAPDDGAANETYGFTLTVTDDDEEPSTNTNTNTVTITINSDPIAMASGGKVTPSGVEVTLNGDGSLPGGDGPLTYSWARTGGTGDATKAGLTEETTSMPKVLPTDDVDDPLNSVTHEFTLTVTDRHGGTDTSMPVTVTVEEPIANPTAVIDGAAALEVRRGAGGTLVGNTGSVVDRRRSLSTYGWARTGGSGNASSLTLGSPGMAQTTFTTAAGTPLPGKNDETHEITLTVTDDQGDTGTALVTVSVMAPPRANAGPDQPAVASGATVQLDGRGSEVGSGRTLETYAWTRASGTAGGTGGMVTLSNLAPAQPTFTAPTLNSGDNSVTYIFTLMVTDNNGFASAADTVIITVVAPDAPPNVAPVADAGPNQRLVTGGLVTLDGSRSMDPDGTTVNYAWARSDSPDHGNGGTVTLSDPAAAKPTFTALTPDAGAADATYGFTLTVTDAGGTTHKDTVTITINAPPKADAGPDRTVASGAPVTLDGSGSSDTTGSFAYAWVRSSGEDRGTAGDETLTGLDTATPTFTAVFLDAGAPDVDYGFTLTVTDADGQTATAMVKIRVTTGNLPPVANAGPDQTVASGAIVTLDGSGSRDPDGTRVTYDWRRPTGDAGGTGIDVTLRNPTSMNPTFTAPTLAVGGTDATYIFTLVVTDDDDIESDPPDTVMITVTAPTAGANMPPVANAGPDQLDIVSGAQVRLDGRGSSDSDGTYILVWELTGGTVEADAPTLSDKTAKRPTFTAPTLMEGDPDVIYIFTLTVTDNDGAMDTDTVRVVVNAVPNKAPVADAAGPDQPVSSGGLVRLYGGASSDDDGRIASWAWVRTGGTGDDTITLTGADTPTPTFMAERLEPGAPDVTHEFTLTVTDDNGGKHTAMVTVTITALSVGIDLSPSSELTVQEGGSGTYRIRLSESPGGDVTIMATSGNEDVVRLKTAQLRFNAENWDEWQDVEINTVAESVKKGEAVKVVIRHSLEGVDQPGDVTVTVRAQEEDPIMVPVGQFIATRATALINNQPGLTGFLKLDGPAAPGGSFTFRATDGQLALNGGFIHNSVWGKVSGAYASSESAAGNTKSVTKSVLASFGVHRKYSEHFLAGVMLQLDLSDHDRAGQVGTTDTIDGTGWLSGPYFAARHGSQPLYFEGRLLYGQSDNDIRFIDTGLGVMRAGSFDTKRLLAQIRVEGEIAMSGRDHGDDGGVEGPRLRPYADLRWIEDRAEAFTDNVNNLVPGQKVSTGQLELGSNVEIPIAVRTGAMTFTGGLGLVWSNTEGDYIGSESRSHGRGEIGFSYDLDDNLQIDFESFYDGIGTSRYEGYGLSLSAEMKF